jgi:hypothetical protein
MSLMWANLFREPLEGVGSETRAFSGPEMATSEASAIWAQKSKFSGPTLSVGPRIGRAQIFIDFRAHPFQWPSKWMGEGESERYEVY